MPDRKHTNMPGGHQYFAAASGGKGRSTLAPSGAMPAPSAWEPLLAAIIESTDDGIISVTLGGDINSWNPAASRIFGISPDEAVGREVMRLFSPDKREEILGLLKRIGAGEHIQRYELDHPWPDGTVNHLALTLSPTHRWEGAGVAGATIIVRDITEQKNAEEKLRNSEAFYHSLVENLPQNILRKDLNERFTFANGRFCETLGQPLEKVIGKTDFDFFPAVLATKYQQDDRRVIETGELFETVEENQPPGGKKLYVHVCKTALRDSTGKIVGVQGIFWDITEQQASEIALRQSEERYRKLLGSVTDYIYTVQVREGRPQMTKHGPGCVNVTGYTPEEYEKVPFLWYNMVHPDDRAAVVEQAARVIAGDAQPLEHRIIHRDGSVRWVRNTQVPRYDDQSRLIAYDGLVSDITERKAAEEKLKHALDELWVSHEELKAAQLLLIRAEKLESVGRLAAGVAHEVKNPLAIIQSGIDYLTQCSKEDENLLGVLRDMKDALVRADSVVRGLLDFSASQELGVKPENLNLIIEKTLSLLRHDLNRTHVVVVREFSQSLPHIRVDRSKLEQVFVNLFINSLHAMSEGGTLTIRTQAKQVEPNEVSTGSGYRVSDKFRVGDSVVVAEVDDTGSGIPPDKLSMIFEPFFTTKPTGKGTGLGLAVTKKIIDLHGGTIDIQNRPSGGVRVRIMIQAEDRT